MTEFRAKTGAAPAGDVLTFPRLKLDPTAFSVTVDGIHIDLTFAEFLIFQEFTRHPHVVLGRDRLAKVVRDRIVRSDAANVSFRSVDTHIARLRAKLRHARCPCIKTMRYVGYRFVPPPAMA